LAWLAGGLYALSGVVVYSDLARRYPESGGEYTFLRHCLHPAFGTAAGWISLVAGFTAPIAVAALGAELYLFRSLGISLAHPWIATGVVLGLGFVHALAPSKGVAFQNIAVLIKVSVIVAFVAFGAAAIMFSGQAQVSTQATNPFPLLAFAGSLVWISYAYSGWNAAVYVTEDIEGGGRIAGRALLAGTILVIALYIGVSAVILYGAPSDKLRGVAESGAVAARALGGPFAETALSGLISLALVTSASSMILSGPRVYARMARDGALPAVFGRMHGDHPRLAILAQALLSVILVWASDLRDLLEFAGVALSLSSGAVVIGWLRQEACRSPRWIKSAVALLFLIFTAGISVGNMAFRPISAAASTCSFSLAWRRTSSARDKPGRPTRDRARENALTEPRRQIECAHVTKSHSATKNSLILRHPNSAPMPAQAPNDEAEAWTSRVHDG
jgi:amino acid transporter